MHQQGAAAAQLVEIELGIRVWKVVLMSLDRDVPQTAAYPEEDVPPVVSRLVKGSPVTLVAD